MTLWIFCKNPAKKKSQSYKSISFILLLFFLLGAIGCGTDSSVNVSNSEESQTTQDIELSAYPLNITSVGANLSIEAALYDSEHNPVSAGVVVHFSTDLPTSTINPSSAATNSQGKVLVSFSAGNTKGTATITASCGVIEKKLTIQITPPSPAGSIEFISPRENGATLGVKGSGLPETMEVAFMVRDNLGRPVADGTVVNFSLLTMGGGEYLSLDSDSTQDGRVSTYLNSGTVSGGVAVSAATEVNGVWLSTSSLNLVICAGPPDDRHFSMAPDKYNIAGLIWDGKSVQISVRLADQYGNPVQEGTSVYFTTECGSVIAKALTDASGLATSDLTSQAPKPRQDGWVTIMAYTTGQESFVDNNANGIYDQGDDFIYDVSEPFLDINKNKAYDRGELFWDQPIFKTEQAWDSGNGKRDKKLFIWRDTEILFSGSTTIWIYDQRPDISQFGRGNIPSNPPYLACSNDSYKATKIVKKGTTEEFYIVVADQLGNPLVNGTSIHIDLVDADKELQQIKGETSMTLEGFFPCQTQKLFAVEVTDFDPNGPYVDPNKITYTDTSSPYDLRVKVTSSENGNKELRLRLQPK